MQSNYYPPDLRPPWNVHDLPDRGPLSSGQLIIAILCIGITSTCVYEYTSYFDLIDQTLAYSIIWTPLIMWYIIKTLPKQSQDRFKSGDSLDKEELKKDLQKLHDSFKDD